MKAAFLTWFAFAACSLLVCAPSLAASDDSSGCDHFTAFSQDGAVRNRWEADLRAANAYYLRAPNKVVETVWIHGSASWGPGHALDQEYHMSFEQLADQHWRVHLVRPVEETFGGQILQAYPLDEMSKRFCALGSWAADPRWIAERDRLLPTQENVLARLNVERSSADSENCPAIITQLGKLDATQRAPSEPPRNYDPLAASFDGPTLPFIGMTASKNGIVVSRSPAVIAWVEETLSALESC